jgi:hypothetical protein
VAVGYRKDVGDVCDRLSRAQQARRRAALKLRKKLLRASTTVEQRNAISDDTQRTLDRTSPIYTAFAGLTPPAHRRPLHEKTARTWKDSLRLLRAYRTSLEAGATRERQIAVLTRFKEGSGRILESNGLDVRQGLEGLGGADCDLAVVQTVSVFTLPPVETPTPTPTPTRAPGAPTPGPTATATGEPPIVPTPTETPPIVPTPTSTPTPTPTPTRVP